MEYLTLTFVASDPSSAIQNLIYLAAKHQCHIEESRMATLGNDFAGVLRIAGNWNNIAKMETALKDTSNDTSLQVQFKRSQPLKLAGNFLPYLSQVVALDTPGLVYEISHFFSNQNIYILDLQTEPFQTSNSDTMMLTLSLRINIPAESNISDLRERFMILCDELNVDGIIEPEKR